MGFFSNLFGKGKSRTPYNRAVPELAIGTWRRERNTENTVVVGALIEGLERDKDQDVRAATAVVLGEIRDPRGIGPLTKALKDKSEIVRVATCTSLGAIADSSSLEPLMTAFFSDTSKAVRGVAIQQIEKFQAVDTLVHILEGNADEHKRALAANLLGLSGDQRAKEPLRMAASKDTSGGVRKAATMALEGKARRFS
jgi:HEAT repeat protein